MVPIDVQILLLLHMEKCQRRINKNTGEIMVCPLADCQEMRNIRKHTIECEAKESCMEPHCSLALQIISHWRNCSRMNCEMCLFLPICAEKFLEPGQGKFHSNSESSGDWHQSLSKVMRVHLVQNIALFTMELLNLKNNNRLYCSALTLAKKYEAITYKKATSRVEYFELIDRKTSQIEKKIDEVRRRMRERTFRQAATHAELFLNRSIAANAHEVGTFQPRTVNIGTEPVTPELLQTVAMLFIGEIVKLKDDATAEKLNSAELSEYFSDNEMNEIEKHEFEIMLESLRQERSRTVEVMLIFP